MGIFSKLLQLIYRPGTDWMSQYNHYLAQEGESVELASFWLNEKGVEPEPKKKFSRLHTESDGIGAMREGLRYHGFRADELPEVPARNQPSYWKVLPQIFRFAKDELFLPPALPWKYKNLDQKFFTYPPKGMVLTEEETQYVIAKATQAKSNFSVYLLHAWAQVVNEIWMSQPTETRWHVPVSVRKENQTTETGNYISNFILNVKPNDDVVAMTIRRRIMLYKGAHIATLFFLNIGDWIGLKSVLKNKVKSDYHPPTVSTRMTGTFSFVGIWPAPHASPLFPGESVVVCGNVSLKNPICTVAILWRGKVSVGVTVHSSICTDEAQIDRAIQRWKEILRTA
jgi:hypothetical protein